MVATIITVLVIYAYTYFVNFSYMIILSLYSGSGNELRIFMNAIIKPWEEIAFALDSFYFLRIFIDFYVEILLSICFGYNPCLWDPRPQHLVISCLLKGDMIFY